jgi:predicted metal-binding protein
MPYATVGPVVNHGVRALCVRPYKGHKRGCPNFGHRAACPPEAALFDAVYDVSSAWAIWNRFAFGEHVASMHGLHPDWSERQLACCLYWQGTARKALRAEVDEWRRFAADIGIAYDVIHCPEAMGVDITATMRQVGVALEWPPRVFAYQVALAARRK